MSMKDLVQIAKKSNDYSVTRAIAIAAIEINLSLIEIVKELKENRLKHYGGAQ